MTVCMDYLNLLSMPDLQVLSGPAVAASLTDVQRTCLFLCITHVVLL